MKTHCFRGIVLCFVLGFSFNALPAFAEQIQIHVTGLNFKYDGTDIFDSTNKLGGSLNTAQADPLTTIDFFKDDVLVGSLSSNIFADLLIKNVQNISKTGGMITTSNSTPGFGFDLLQTNGAQTNSLLSLDIKNLTLSYSGYGFFIAVGGLADNIVSQNLPFGLTLSTNDQVSLLFSSSNLTNITTSGDYLSGFNAFGTSDVNGTQRIPEPSSTIALLSLAATGLISLVRRRRK